MIKRIDDWIVFPLLYFNRKLITFCKIKPNKLSNWFAWVDSKYTLLYQFFKETESKPAKNNK